jgi:hypothetical protein
MSKRNENRRALGRTGEKISILGLGGYHIGVPEAAEGIATAAATGNYERFKTSTQFDGTPPPAIRNGRARPAQLKIDSFF